MAESMSGGMVADFRHLVSQQDRQAFVGGEIWIGTQLHNAVWKLTMKLYAVDLLKGRVSDAQGKL